MNSLITSLIIFWNYAAEFFHPNGSWLYSHTLNGVTNGSELPSEVLANILAQVYSWNLLAPDALINYLVNPWHLEGKKIRLPVDEPVICVQTEGSIFLGTIEIGQANDDVEGIMMPAFNAGAPVLSKSLSRGWRLLSDDTLISHFEGHFDCCGIGANRNELPIIWRHFAIADHRLVRRRLRQSPRPQPYRADAWNEL